MLRKSILIVASLVALPALAETAAMPTPTKTAPAPAPMKQAMATTASPLDVNTATVEQLSSAKGLNRTFAEAIIKGRPYKSLDELTKNKVLPEGVFARVKSELTIGQH
jgi:DNA uptake protein ComE-like DNA-binding protein